MANVKLYNSATCPHCQKAKKFLKDNGVPFKDYNVTDDHEKAEEMQDKYGTMSVPVIDVDGKAIRGFDEKELKKTLNL